MTADTVQSLHDMLVADIFIRSISGLTMQVVRYIGRGVMLCARATSRIDAIRCEYSLNRPPLIQLLHGQLEIFLVNCSDLGNGINHVIVRM